MGRPLKQYHVVALDTESICRLAASLFSRKLRVVNVHDNEPEIDTQIVDKFIRSYRIVSEEPEDYSLIRISTDTPDTYIVMPIFKEDYAIIQKKAKFLKTLIGEIIN